MYRLTNLATVTVSLTFAACGADERDRPDQPEDVVQNYDPAVYMRILPGNIKLCPDKPYAPYYIFPWKDDMETVLQLYPQNGIGFAFSIDVMPEQSFDLPRSGSFQAFMFIEDGILTARLADQNVMVSVGSSATQSFKEINLMSVANPSEPVIAISDSLVSVAMLPQVPDPAIAAMGIVDLDCFNSL